ncbi:MULTISPECIES: hypothetical protein [unclassified Pseudomonas]|uniref:hypothetical protein n=1 Tax=unclassified Pseudomonas TaxID=196821 RepID=UPI001786F6EA|nr:MULTISPECIES: hypothetical protein [unclassified Pseudomonas]MBD8595325.1 hypothetical protein [Pseudomonas sp. CFBP 8758]MBD8621328.1 hypothetical protein [Pseudomonas sp. CFBP 13727]
MKAICTAALTALLLGCATSGGNPAMDAHSLAPPGAAKLSGNDIASQFVGRSHQSVTSNGQSFSEILTADGAAKINMTGMPEAKGSWKITGDVICVTYSAYGEECNIVKADERWFWFVDSVKGTTNNRFAR